MRREHLGIVERKRGQVEISFQWIFVLIAIGAFLAIFIIVLRSCTQSGTTRVSVASLTSAATLLSGVAWQTQATSNTTIRADVTCQGGSLVLSAPGSDSAGPYAALDAIPAFLPPSMNGRVTLIRRNIVLPETASETTPGLLLGNALYAIDEKTHYYVIKDSDTSRNEQERIHDFLGDYSNVQYVDSINSITVPKTAAAAIIVDVQSQYVGNWNNPPNVPVYQVSLNPTHLPYPEVKFTNMSPSGQFNPIGTLNYETTYLEVGAMIAGRPETYKCAKASVIDRMRRITVIYKNRTDALYASYPTQTDACPTYLSNAMSALTTENGQNDNDYLPQVDTDLRASGPAGALFLAQDALYSAGCPVIG